MTDAPAEGQDPSDRQRQIAALLGELRRQGIDDERVLTAMTRVPRELFVLPSSQGDAWLNVALPIGSGQTISQPYIVALMTQSLALRGGEHVLEIGTGSGYQTAMLATLVPRGNVVSIERHAALASTATDLLRQMGFRNVTIHVGDGTTGWPDDAPFDRIVVTAAAPRVPPELLRQLSPDHGRMVIPVGEADTQFLVAVDRDGDQFHEHRLGSVRFVPLIGRGGWAERMQPNGDRGE